MGLALATLGLAAVAFGVLGLATLGLVALGLVVALEGVDLAVEAGALIEAGSGAGDADVLEDIVNVER